MCKAAMRTSRLQPSTAKPSQGRGAGAVRPDADGRTILSYGTKARVSGRLAAVGAPIIEIAVQELAENFFNRFRDYAHKFAREARTASAQSLDADAVDDVGGAMDRRADVRRPQIHSPTFILEQCAHHR